MISRRLWRQVSRPDNSNPIINRFRDSPRSSSDVKRVTGLRRLAFVAAAVAVALLVFNPTQILVLIFVLPMLLITVIVLTPLLLPLLALLAGAYLVAEVINSISREKYQHTYELMCACTEGALHANWSCAIGVLHRDGWFAALRWGMRLSLRIGLVALAGLMILGLWLLLSDHRQVGLEQGRIILVVLTLLVVYGAQLGQSLLLSLIIGLAAGSFDWQRRDALLVGTTLYVLAQSLPLALALVAYLGGRRLLGEAHPMLMVTVEVGALLVVVLVRELMIALLWVALRRRLNSSRDEVSQGGMAAVLGIS